MKTFKKHLEEKRCWPGYKPVPGKEAYSKGSCVKEEVELNEMDKTQTSPGRDGDIDWTKKQIHLGPESIIKAKDVAKHALKTLDKTMKKSQKRDVKEEAEQLDELSVNKMLKYSDAAEKDRQRLNAKWDAKTASEREQEKVIGREKGERRAADKIKQKTGKYPWQLNKEDSECNGTGEDKECPIHGMKNCENLKEDWQKVNKSDKTDGLSQAAVNAYRRENPGSKLQTAVTKDPSKLKAGSKDAKRRLSFCRRMRGMKNRLTNPENARDPDSPVNKALRRWNC